MPVSYRVPSLEVRRAGTWGCYSWCLPAVVGGLLLSRLPEGRVEEGRAGGHAKSVSRVT